MHDYWTRFVGAEFPGYPFREGGRAKVSQVGEPK